MQSLSFVLYFITMSFILYYYIPHLLSAGKVKTTNKRPYVGVNGTVEGVVIQSDKPLCYEENGELPPYDDEYGSDADTLGGHPAEDFVLDSELTEALAGKADAVHTHEIAQVTGLQSALDGKSPTTHNHDGVYAPVSHTHTTAQVTGLDTALAGKANSSHTHSISDVTNLQTTLNGKAASSHNHSASNITSGTLPTSRGGTGITTNPSMLINLGSTTAANVFQTSPRPGVTGTLPVARGGTGVTSISALKTALGIPSSFSVPELFYAKSGTEQDDGSYDYIKKFSTPKTAAALIYAYYLSDGQYTYSYFVVGRGLGSDNNDGMDMVCGRGQSLNAYVLNLSGGSNSVDLPDIDRELAFHELKLEGALTLSADGTELRLWGNSNRNGTSYLSALILAV